MSSPILSSSPTSTMMPPEAFSEGTREQKSEALCLEEFVEALPQAIKRMSLSEKGEATLKGDPEKPEQGSKEDPIADLFGRLVLDRDEWERFAFFEQSKNYTRNLIATDGKTFTLLLLCWNPGRESPIHDHPCDGCWMRLCEGAVHEQRYVQEIETDRLTCYSDKVFQEKDTVVYIEDSMGYHKVGNPSEAVPAVTLHLYCPPFQRCKIWLDPDHASCPSLSCVCLHSEYGVCV